MAGLIGRIGEYEQGKEEWTQYCERLEYYFAANGVLEEAKKKSIFLTVIGSSSYKLYTKEFDITTKTRRQDSGGIDYSTTTPSQPDTIRNSAAIPI